MPAITAPFISFIFIEASPAPIRINILFSRFSFFIFSCACLRGPIPMSDAIAVFAVFSFNIAIGI